jgi:hypothetical protein
MQGAGTKSRFVDFVAGQPDHPSSEGKHPIHRSGTVPGGGESGGSADRWDVAGAIRVFSGSTFPAEALAEPAVTDTRRAIL